jgi:uncharacterized protein YcnI
MKKIAFTVALTLGLLVPAGAALAHVEITTSSAPAGKKVDLNLEIGHGCDGASTTGLVVQVPAQATKATALPTDGWKAKSTATTLTWTGGPLPDHDVQLYPFSVVLNGKKGETAMFKAIQKCEGGAETAWIQPTSGGEEPEYPAPSITLASTAVAPVEPAPDDQQAAADQVAEAGAAATGEPTATEANAEDTSGSDDGGDSKTVILLVIAGLAIGTVAGLVLRSRRKSQG